MDIKQLRTKFIGKVIKHAGRQGTVTNINNAKRPNVLVNLSEGIDVGVPEQFDIEITYNDGSRETIKNAQF